MLNNQEGQMCLWVSPEPQPHIYKHRLQDCVINKLASHYDWNGT